MKSVLKIILLSILFTSLTSRSQTIDTLIDVGNHKLHFTIIKGEGIPILFENGAGDNTSIWSSIVNKIHDITGTTVITYDRAGFGGSTINTLDTVVSNHGIMNSVEDLEIGLKALGYDQEIMLVAHSYGGHMATLYSIRHPDLVKAIVLVDVTHDFYFGNDYFGKKSKSEEKALAESQKTNLGFYYLASNFPETVRITGLSSIPTTIPVIDFINDIPLFKEKDKIEHWKDCHKKFVRSHPKSIGIIAHNCSHYIWLDNTELINMGIVKAYVETLDEKQKLKVYQQALDYSIDVLNKEKVNSKR